MAAATSGIWSHHGASAQALPNAKPNPMTGPAGGTGGTSGTGGSSTTASGTATISANDFLTLLVTEMRNQDPTADTDPNEYINQLVNVNSLEQLISINQNLSTALGVSNTSSTSSRATGTSAASPTAAADGAPSGAAQAAAHKSKVVAGIESFAGSTTATNPAASVSAANKRIAGNLSIPATAPASERVAQSLNGRHAPRQIKQ